MRSEFHGVVDQVVDDVAEASRIEHHLHQAVHLGGHRQLLLARRRRVLRQRRVHGLGHQAGRRMELEPPGLDMGQVEDVVDQGEKLAAAVVDRLRKFGAFRQRQLRGRLDDLREADDRVQRCA